MRCEVDLRHLQCDHEAGRGAVGVGDYKAACWPTLHALLVRNDVQMGRVDMRNEYGHSYTHTHAHTHTQRHAIGHRQHRAQDRGAAQDTASASQSTPCPAPHHGRQPRRAACAVVWCGGVFVECCRAVQCADVVCLLRGLSSYLWFLALENTLKPAPARAVSMSPQPNTTQHNTTQHSTQHGSSEERATCGESASGPCNGRVRERRKKTKKEKAAASVLHCLLRTNLQRWHPTPRTPPPRRSAARWRHRK